MTLEELNGHFDLLTQLAEAKETYKTAQARILGAMQYDGMPHANEPSRRPENLSIYLERTKSEVDRLERMVKRSETDIRVFVDSIGNQRTRSIFDLRFLCGMKWEDVAVYVGGGSTYDSVRTACYRYLNQTNDKE